MMKQPLIIALLLMVALGASFAVGDQAAAKIVTGEDIAEEALKYVGYPIDDFDSAYAVHYLYKKKGIDLPKTLDGLKQEGTSISKVSDLKPGDILFFGTSQANLIAAGIYINEDHFFVAYEPYEEAKLISTDDAKAKRYYLGAKRIIDESAAEETDESNEPDQVEDSTQPDDSNQEQQQEDSQESTSDIGQRVIEEGLKYLGTPYEFGSRGSSTETFDCSAFVRRAYYDATGEWLPRTGQYKVVKEKGNTITDWRDLQVGDLMFFTEPGTDKIYHVALYMGDGKMLHTFSVRSGGVRVDEVKGFWDRQFIYGGSPLD
jgi:cell wall-associated NlpC family hydrolase